MKKNEDLQKDVHDAFKRETLSDAGKTGLNSKVGKGFKKFIYITSLAAIGISFNGCLAGYIATEPTYVEVSRPPQPSNLHIWIDGDWAWNSQSHVYVQRAGYWEKPRQSQTFVSGHWQASPKGKYWVSGRWQRQNSRGNNRSR